MTAFSSWIRDYPSIGNFGCNATPKCDSIKTDQVLFAGKIYTFLKLFWMLHCLLFLLISILNCPLSTLPINNHRTLEYGDVRVISVECLFCTLYPETTRLLFPWSVLGVINHVSVDDYWSCLPFKLHEMWFLVIYVISAVTTSSSHNHESAFTFLNLHFQFVK